MRTLSLNGTWELTQTQKNIRIPAQVPGCVHTDLRAAELIPDPYYRDNELELMWIGNSDWAYSRSFTLDSAVLAHEKVLLVCEGLDTLASIIINGKSIGETDNAFRTWEFDIKQFVREGSNEISIAFSSTYPYGEQGKSRRPIVPLNDIRQYVRKSQCNYGWDWGPKCVTAGIWRTIAIKAFSCGRLEDIHILQNHSNNNVELTFNGTVGLTGKQKDLIAEITLSYVSKEVYKTKVPVSSDGKFTGSCKVNNAHLWWPAGMGDQPLYTVTVKLTKGQDPLDTLVKTIGLRTLVLDRHADQWGESFQFVVNDVPFFAKGANWIPADTFVTSIKDTQYEELLYSAREANFNMLRVWGGGIYEQEIFYDLCDRLGITIWQDFMFACAYYPSYENSFTENVRQEIIQNVKQLRHHPSIALWCGNNEIEQTPGWIGLGTDPAKGQMTWEEYGVLFDNVIPAVVKQHDPSGNYWPSSPHSPIGDRLDHSNHRSGDAHLWAVWHGRQPFEWYRTSEHRFNSEFGFQSFPEPKTVRTFTKPEDRNITSRIMEHHQRSGSGNELILHYMLSWYQLPVGFDMTCWLSQIQQGMSIKYAVEHYRRNMPRCMGALYWQINDCWPVASWASIDSLGNWKALHYMARRFFAPVLLSMLENENDTTIEFHVSSDLPEEQQGTIRWQVTDTAGKVLNKGESVLTIGKRSSVMAHKIDLSSTVTEHGKYSSLIWAELIDSKGTVLSDNFATFVRPKHIELINPELVWDVEKIKEVYEITVSCKHPSLWTWIDIDLDNIKLSDNFFNCRGEKKIILTGKSLSTLSTSELKNKIKVNSLWGTYQE